MRGIIVRNINRSSRRIFSENSMSSIKYDNYISQDHIQDLGINKTKDIETLIEPEGNKMNKIFEEILKYNLS